MEFNGKIRITHTFGVDMQKGIDTVTDIFGRARSFVTSAINGTGTIFRVFFGGIAEFFDGIRGRVGGITSQVSDLMKPITDFFHDSRTTLL